MTLKDKRIAELKTAISEVEPAQAETMQRDGAVLVDVREPDEVAGGSPLGALRLVRGFLELRIEAAVPDLDTSLLVMCARGVRSLFAAEGLVRLGYRNVHSVSLGFNGWKNAGLPIEIPQMLDGTARERYGRHLLIPEIGEAGQLELLRSKVLVIGAGGLGSPVAYYLAAAGIGTLGIVDDDVVDRSNLQRQILHHDGVVGKPKVDSARATLSRFNPDIEIRTHPLRLARDDVVAGEHLLDVVAGKPQRMGADLDVGVEAAQRGARRVDLWFAHDVVDRSNLQRQILHVEDRRRGANRRSTRRAPR